MSTSVVNHIGLCVHDIDRSRRFHEELLGFEYERVTHISIGAADHRRLLDRVEGLGGEVVSDTDIGVAVFIRDPDGQLIELLETKGAGRA